MKYENVGPTRTGLEIAVIGLAGKFPGSRNSDEFWNNLKNGVESISFFSDEELMEEGIGQDEISSPNYVKAKAALENVDYFDAPFFGYNGSEAEIMDPQLRFLHEHSWIALEDAGYNPHAYDGSIGLFVGATQNSYWEHLSILSGKDAKYGQWGTSQLLDRDFFSTRVSYKLNLRGPSMLLQTACSTSLVAIHAACRSLLMGECDISLAGGVSITLPNKSGYGYQEGMIMSSDGHCRAFDAEANGTVMGNGGGLVVLKRLKYAIEDGDNIYAVIKGSSINNDGIRKVGYTAPSIEGQSNAIETALKVAKVSSESIGYIEAHGTGTTLGDPIEIAGLKRAFKTDKRKYCAIGSVKTNIGHLDVAAGVAGFIKTALALKNRVIPPSLNFETSNPKIDFENSPFYVNTKLAKWEGGFPLRAGVSSFGIGGTNAHVILEEAPQRERSGESRAWKLLTLSARSEAALKKASSNLADCLVADLGMELADAAYTLAVGRKEFNYRRAIVCSDINEAIQALNAENMQTHPVIEENTSTVFMFPGQGSQYVNMCRGLYQEEPYFKEELDRCIDILNVQMGIRVQDVLFPDEETEEAAEQIKNTGVAQPILFAVEYALAKLLMKWGIQPSAMIGHSLGEYTAACIAGVFSLEDGLKLMALRGALMQQMPAGAMLSVPMSEEELLPLLKEGLGLAAVNGRELCVVSGRMKAIDELEAELKEKGCVSLRLHTSHAFHSEMMDPILDQFEKALEEINLKAPQLPFISNVSGRWITEEEAKSPQYWSKHLRQTVRFGDGISEIMGRGSRVYIEVGPGMALSKSLEQERESEKAYCTVNMVRHPKVDVPDLSYLMTKIGTLWSQGVAVDWRAFYSNEKRYRVSLPTYPFEHKSYWINGDPVKMALEQLNMGIANSKRVKIDDWTYYPSWKKTPVQCIAERKNKLNEEGWLIFEDTFGLSSTVHNELSKAGCNAICVRKGTTYKKINNNLYEIRASELEDYENLIQTITKDGVVIQNIVHLWGVFEDTLDKENINDELDQVDNVLEDIYHSLLYMAQSIGRTNITNRINIFAVVNDMFEILGDERTNALKACILGPAKVIPQEYTNIRFSVIDIHSSSLMLDQLTALSDALINEFGSDFTDKITAYRANSRWVQTFEPIQLKKPVEDTVELKKEGVFLITGGLGGVGLVLAEHLAKEASAKLILINRSTFPERSEWNRWIDTFGEQDETSCKIKKLLELEQYGADILILSADVSDYSQMNDAFKEAVQRFGHINGVIHAAGVPDGAVLQLRNKEMSDQVMNSKIKGTLILNHLIKDSSLDFFVLCSSISAIVAPIGQVAYCAANSFMDNFSWDQSQNYNGALHSLNWDRWENIGMSATPSRDFSEKKSAHPLFDICRTEEGDKTVYISKLNPASHWVLDEHRIFDGKAVLPGTAYIEMVTEIMKNMVGNLTIDLREVYLIVPLIIEDDEEKVIKTVVKNRKEVYEFTVSSKSDKGWQTHAKGEVILPRNKAEKHTDLRQLIDECSEDEVLLTKEEKAAYAEAVGFGPRWFNINSIMYGDRRGIATLELSNEFITDLDNYNIHPAMLDMSLSFLNQRIIDEGDFVPFSYKYISITKALPQKVISYVKCIEGNSSSYVFNIMIMDEYGDILVEIREFTIVRTSYMIDAATTSSTAAAEQLRFDEEDISGKVVTRMQNGILPIEGIDVFSRVIAGKMPQVIISTRDLHLLIRDQDEMMALSTNEARNLSKAETGHSRPELTSEYKGPGNELESKLTDMWGDFFGYSQVGIHDNFFDLGGDSLRAINMVARLRKELDVEVLLSVLFARPTISELSLYISEIKKDKYESIQPTALKAHYELSSTQKRLYILQQMDPTNTGYNIVDGLILEGRIDLERIENTFRQLIKRHMILRTTFGLVNGELVQQIHDKFDFKLQVRDSSEESLSDDIKGFIQPFILSQLPLIRAIVFRLQSNKHVLVVDMHHITADATSSGILVKEFAQLYAGQNLSTLQLQYKDIAEWQNKLLQSEQVGRQKEYWMEAFREPVPTLNLPIDYSRPAVQSFEGDVVLFKVPAELRKKVKIFESKSGTTLYQVLFAVYNVMLMKYCGQEDIVVGSLTAGRSRIEMENMIGAFITTLALRNRPEKHKRFIDFLDEVKMNNLKAFENADYQFEDLVENIRQERDLSRNPIFDTMLILQNMENSVMEIAGLNITPITINLEASLLDMRWIVWDGSEGLDIKIEYAKKIFKKSTIERIANSFKYVLEQAVRKPEQKLHEFNLLTNEDERVILHDFNNNHTDYTKYKNICSYLEQHAAGDPDKIAVRCSEEEMSYSQLNHKTNQIARFLMSQGLSKEGLVGILMDRSILMMESILAVWKIGGAYIPLDPASPKERLLEILEESNPCMILTMSHCIMDEFRNEFEGKVVVLDENDLVDTITRENGENLDIPYDCNSLAYVIFTSGSTGKPKGAMVEHKGMMNHMQSKVSTLQLEAGSRISQNAPHCFDISIWQLFTPLITGGRCIIYPNQMVMDIDAFITKVADDQINILEVVPSYLTAMLDYLETKQINFEELRYLLVTGETTKKPLIKRWLDKYPLIPIVNAYGPTEASDDITHNVIPDLPEGELVPIGKPIQNMNIYIVNDDMELCPIGVKGEILVSGIGVGRGYLNDSEKSERTFMQDPFKGTGMRLYKTGDLGRWLSDGNVEFHGRKDHQVKIRGFRIESGEIENKLLSHAEIKEAIVIDREDKQGDKYLCAYIRTTNYGVEDTERFKKFLAQNLPDYMIPAYWVKMEHFPLTSNGKIDRNALPESELTTKKNIETCGEPSNGLECKLLDIWKKVLNNDNIGVHGDFFDLGGHSLAAIKLEVEMENNNLQIDYSDIYKYPTIKAMALFLESKQEESPNY